MKKLRKYIQTFSFLITLATTSLYMLSCGDRLTGKEGTFVKTQNFLVVNFTINPAADTTLFGPQGTRVFIGAETFQFNDSTPVTGSIKIKLKEFYKPEDIILGDLATISEGKLLETSGMIHLSATSNGKELAIKDNKRLVVHFPKAETDLRTMDLFYADPTSASDSSVSNWNLDTVSLVKRTLKLASFGWWYPEFGDSTGYDFTPKDYVDTGYYWNPLDFYVESYDFSESTKKEVETVLNTNKYPQFEYWNDYGVECDMRISTTGFIKDINVRTAVSKSTKKEMIQFFKDLPQLEPGKNKKGEIIERRGLVFIQGGNVIPLHKTNMSYLKSFDTKYAKYEDSPIQSMADAELNFYIFSVSKLGWINCDRFIDVQKTVDLMVETPVDIHTKVKMVFSDIDAMLPASIIDGKYVFSGVPAGKKVTIFAIKNKDGQLTTAFNDITVSNKPVKDLVFSETTLGALRVKLSAM